MTIKNVQLTSVHPNPFCVRDPKGESMAAESINRLAYEIDEFGFWDSPIPARKRSGGGYETAFGRRRVAALKKLGKKTVKLDVAPYSDEEMIKMGAVENMQREDLTHEEKVDVWRQMLELTEGDVIQARRLLGVAPNTSAAWQAVVEWEAEEELEEEAEEDEPRGGKSDVANTPKGKPFKPSPYVVLIAKRLGGDPMIRFATKQKWMHTDARRFSKAITEACKKYAALDKFDVVELILEKKPSSHEKVDGICRREIDRRMAERLGPKLPPDLVDVVEKWNKTTLPKIIEELEQIASQKVYADYIMEGSPTVAKTFQENLKQLGKVAAKLEGLMGRIR